VALFVVGCSDKAPSNPNCTATGTACSAGASECCTGHCDELCTDGICQGIIL
jgi:hypothetical protein